MKTQLQNRKTFLKLFLVAALVCSIAITSKVGAQDTLNKIIPPPSFNIAAEFAIPVGDLNLITPLGLGASGKFIFPLSDIVAFTASGGYIYYFEKSFEGESFGGFHSIPFKGGLRFISLRGFYFEPQLGYSIFGSDGDSDGAFTYAGNIGYLIKNFDISARYESATKNGSSLSHIGIRVGLNLPFKK